MIIKKENNIIIIQSNYNPVLLDKIKDCPGRKWMASKKVWTAPLTSLAYLLNTFLTAKYIGLEQEIEAIKIERKKQEEIINNLHTDYKPHPSLYSYQKDIVKSALQNKTFGLFMETGTGKTFVALELIRYLKEQGIGPALVVCPLALIKGAWEEDCKRFESYLKLVSLRDNELKEKQDIYALNYEMAKKQLENLKTFGFKVLILDESSKIKDIKTKTTKGMLQLAESIPYRFLLSGTPAPNNQLEYYAQLKILGSVNKGFYSWRNEFFYPGGYRGYQWFFRKSKELEFMNQFKDRATFLKKEDCLGLPEKTFIPVPVILSSEEIKEYERVEEEILLEFEGKDSTLTIQNALARMAKLRQCASGFLYGEKSGEIIWDCSPSGKILVLGELLESISGQVIIWVQFRKEKQEISKYLENISFACITGEEDELEKVKSIEKFKSGKARVLIAHPRSAGHGLTFTNCSYAIYYSLSFSYEEFAQSQDRIHRIGQHFPCTYYILQAQDTLEEEIYKVVQKKEAVSLSILRNMLRI